MIHLAEKLKHIGLFLEPGLGKSVTALTILKEHATGSALVVAPKRVAESVWAQECQKWEHLKDMRVVKIMGSPKDRMMALYAEADVYIINVDNMAWLVDNWVEGRFRNLIIDESSRFKDPSTKRFKALKKVLRSFERRIIATGTPTPQGYGDLWAQVAILDLGDRLGSSLTKFRDKYMYASERNRHTGVVYKWALQPNADVAIQKRIEDICFSMKAEDYLTLPKLTKIYHSIELDSDVMAKYKQLKKDMVSEIDGEQITAVTAAALANKLLQFTSGTMYTEDGMTALAHTTKVEFLESIMEENQAPALVFYHYKTALAKLKEAFPYAEELTDANIERWRRGEVRMLLAHPQSGGIGLNLQCNTGDVAQVVWYDLPWSSENYIQANARVYRQGQTKPVILHHLIAAHTIDGQVVDVLDGKVTAQEALLNALKL